MADSKRDYVVLKRTSPDLFQKIGSATASSSESAIRIALDAVKEPQDGDYVAVASRSFQLVPVKVKIRETQFEIGKPPKPEQALASAAGEMRRELGE